LLARWRLAVPRLKAKGEDIAPERAVARERDQRLAQIAEGELAKFVHQAARAPAAVGHRDDGGNRALKTLEARKHREGSRAAPNRDHLFIEQVGSHMGFPLGLLVVALVFHAVLPLRKLSLPMRAHQSFATIPERPDYARNSAPNWPASS